jgi:3-hydroxybutyryl-CoA dehydrogenase
MPSATAPRTVGVVGGGTMGIGIAYVYAAAGSRVSLVEPSAARQAALKNVLAEAAASGVARGKLTSDAAEMLKSRIDVLSDAADLERGLDLVVETVPELPELKRRVIGTIAERSPRLLASNTSSISIDALARSTADPARFFGMHFFNPVWSLPFVELIQGEATSPETISLARSYAEATGKTTIVSRDVPGFATSRLDVLSAMEAIRMLEDGVASAEDIDKAMVTAFRHPVGPLKLCDIVGLDVRLDIGLHLAGALGDRFAPPQLLKDKVARGELGVKSGRGFYDWSETRAFVSRSQGAGA